MTARVARAISKRVEQLDGARRSANDVVGRVMGLRAIMWRAQFELAARSADRPRDLELRNERHNLWVSTSQVPVSPRERQLLDRGLGTWSMAEIGELVWRNQAAFALLWALGHAEMPPYTTIVSANIVFEHVERMFARIAPQLRSAVEIDRAIELAELWNWRGRTETLRRRGVPPPPADSYEATVARAMRSAVEAQLVDAADVADGDLLVGDMRYATLDHKTFIEVSCIAHERHWALHWLVDTAAWDDAMPAT